MDAEAVRKYQREYYAKNKEKIKARNAKWRKGKPRSGRKRTIWKEWQEAIIFYLAQRDGWQCDICGQAVNLDDASINHIIPACKGGVHRLENFSLTHRSCNTKQGHLLRRKQAYKTQY